MVQQRFENRRRGRCRGEAGESLAELLVTVGILGIAVVVIVGAMAVAISISARHRQQANANTVLLSAAESVKSQTWSGTCPAAYTPASGVTLPTGWSATNVTASVTYLNDAGAAVACSGSVKLQVVTVTVTAPANVFSSSVQVMKRNSA
jgi:type II secretory pathway pseudopilin PulG